MDYFKVQILRFIHILKMLQENYLKNMHIDGKSNEILSSNDEYSIVILGNTNLSYEVILQACIMGQLPNENKLSSILLR